MIEETNQLVLPCKRKASSESYETPHKHPTTQSKESKHGLDTVLQQRHEADKEESLDSDSKEGLGTPQLGQDATTKREFYTTVPSSLCTFGKYHLLQIPIPAKPSGESIDLHPKQLTPALPSPLQSNQQEVKLADHTIAPICASLDQRNNLKCKYACTTNSSKAPSKKKRETIINTELPMCEETLEDLLDTLTITDVFIEDCWTSTLPSNSNDSGDTSPSWRPCKAKGSCV
jgi:hypothetical protein